MEQKTRDHIEVAQRNREFVAWLLAPPANPPSQATQWAAIAAFYGAVHIVNAYIWEVYRLEPMGHRQRARFTLNDSALSAIGDEYRILSRLGWSSRYDPEFRLSAEDARESLIHLEQIINLVTAELPDEE